MMNSKQIMSIPLMPTCNNSLICNKLNIPFYSKPKKHGAWHAEGNHIDKNHLGQEKLAKNVATCSCCHAHAHICAPDLSQQCQIQKKIQMFENISCSEAMHSKVGMKYDQEKRMARVATKNVYILSKIM